MSIKKSKVRFQGDGEIFKTLKALKKKNERNKKKYVFIICLKKIFQMFGPIMIYLEE